MPQGKGTYGSQVGRPSKKRTSFVNDNKWYDTVSSASNRYNDLSEGQGGEESDTKRGRVIVESSFTGPEYRRHLDSMKTRGSPKWEKESASLNKAMDYGKTWENARKSTRPSSFETPYFQKPDSINENTLASGAVPNYSKHQRDLHRQARRRVTGKVRNVKNSRGQIIGN